MPQLSGSRLNFRAPHFADDRWYNANPAKLRQEIQKYLAGASLGPKLATVLGLVAPHAGHFYSGHVAAASFANLTPGQFELVVLVGPDHRGAAPGQISTPNAENWRTPLGDIAVAWEVLDKLQVEQKLALLSTDNEHSLEIELPFLQETLHQFKLIPLLMGDQSWPTCQALAEALVKAGQGYQTLFVASSDLSHYFDDDTARHLDEETLRFILNLDAAGLIRHVESARRRGEPLACGYGPIAVVILAAQALGATRTSLLKYATSADVYPDKSQVVGYAAVAIGKDV